MLRMRQWKITKINPGRRRNKNATNLHNPHWKTNWQWDLWHIYVGEFIFKIMGKL